MAIGNDCNRAATISGLCFLVSAGLRFRTRKVGASS